jgi:hypothetical protein
MVEHIPITRSIHELSRADLTIEAQSVPGEGTTIRFSLPIE